MQVQQPPRTGPQGQDIGDQVWADVLDAVDRTYAELVSYQEQLESRNAELMALRAFLSSIMTSISDHLIVADKSGAIADVSLSCSTALGRDKPSLIGQTVGVLFADNCRARVLDGIARSVAQRAEVSFEACLNTPGEPEPVELRIAPRLDRRRKAAGVILTARPLGELRRAYSELEASHEELKQAQIQLVRNEKLASLGRLLAGVAHELNNPISFVYANTHALEKYLDRFETYFQRVQAGAPREELVELRQRLRLDRDLKNLRTAIEGARDGSERVRSIVEDLRRLSSDGAGDVMPFDFTETTRIATNWVARGTRSDLTIFIDGEPACRALGRPGHIQQVVMNLVQNAADAMRECPGKDVRLNLFYEGDRAILDVCDCGPGIPDALVTSIFDPFFTTKEVGQGTGLGLPISHKIAQEHGGELSLLRTGPEGSCFRLALRRGDRP